MLNAAYLGVRAKNGMGASNKQIRAALKKTLVPFLEAEGFAGKFPEFNRTEKEELQLLSVQFDKWGGGFFLEFARHPLGPKLMSWGETVPEEELTVIHAPFDTRARLQEWGSKSSDREHWFRYEGLSAEECATLVEYVVKLFPQVNEWLREKKVGPNISAAQPYAWLRHDCANAAPHQSPLTWALATKGIGTRNGFKPREIRRRSEPFGQKRRGTFDGDSV